MFSAIIVKRPTEGRILRAGKGCWGAFEGGGGALRRACPEAVVPETEGPDPAHNMGPVMDCPLQTFHPTVRGGLRVYGSPARHRALEISCKCWGQGHWAQVVFCCAPDRMGAGLVQSDRRECGSEEKGDVKVREEGNPRVVVGGDSELRLTMAGDCVDAEARGTLEAGYVPCGTACRSTKSLRLKALRNVR